jgi:hypothetical protein
MYAPHKSVIFHEYAVNSARRRGVHSFWENRGAGDASAAMRRMVSVDDDESMMMGMKKENAESEGWSGSSFALAKKKKKTHPQPTSPTTTRTATFRYRSPEKLSSHITSTLLFAIHFSVTSFSQVGLIRMAPDLKPSSYDHIDEQSYSVRRARPRMNYELPPFVFMLNSSSFQNSEDLSV